MRNCCELPHLVRPYKEGLTLNLNPGCFFNSGDSFQLPSLLCAAEFDTCQLFLRMTYHKIHLWAASNNCYEVAKLSSVNGFHHLLNPVKIQCSSLLPAHLLSFPPPPQSLSQCLILQGKLSNKQKENKLPAMSTLRLFSAFYLGLVSFSTTTKTNCSTAQLPGALHLMKPLLLNGSVVRRI